MWHKNYCFYLIMAGYVIIGSVILFAVNIAEKSMYIDEIFHVPQCQNYCTGKFFKYDPKLTTPPGLYIITLSVVLPLSFLFGINFCILSVLRTINFVVSILLLVLIHRILNLKIHTKPSFFVVEKAWLALNITTLPVLFFFAFFYYTDMISTFFVLLTYYLYNSNRSHLAGFVGAFSVIIRQNNVIWFCLFAFIKCCEKVEEEMLRTHKQNRKYDRMKMTCIKTIVNESFLFIRRSCFHFMTTILKETYFLIITVFFLIYVIIRNGSLVLGDKSAHEAVIHIPQLFYFSLFLSVFSFPSCIFPILELLKKHRTRIFPLSLLSFFIAIVLYLNTMDHLYLISDNRHYTFYLWRRILGKPIEKFILVPVYTICMYCIYKNTSHVNGYIKLGYLLSTILCLVPHKLLELRYFIIPYVLYRIETGKFLTRWQLLLENIFTSAINILTIRLFLIFTFQWPDGSVQRLSW